MEFVPNNCYPCMIYNKKLSGGMMVVKTEAEHKAVLENLEPKAIIIDPPKAPKAQPAKKVSTLKFDME